MLIYNTLCPTVNHSFQYEIWKSRYPQVHNPKISPSLYDYDEMIPTKVKTQVPFEELSERRTKGYIYYTLNVDDAFDFLDSFSSQSLLNFQSEQDDYIEKQMEDLLSFKLISPAAAKITREQYSKILFIEGLGFDRSYVGDIINAKLKSHSEDVITNFIPQEPTKPNQQIGINREELMRIANFKPEVVIDNKLYPLKWQDEYIRDKSRYIYILGSRQIGKSMSTAYIAFENSFIPQYKILVSSFSANSTNNMRDYILEFAKNTPNLPNGQEAFTYHSKEAFIINNLTKAKIFFRTLAEEGKGIRGMKLNLVIIDEAAFVANEIYERVLKPTTTTTKGRIIALSTPEKKNWFYDKVMEAMKYKDDPSRNTSLYEIDYTKNPFIYNDPELLKYIEENKHKPGVRQEYMCEFAGDGESVFSVNLSDFFPELNPKDFYVLGYDPARKGKDRAGYALSHIRNGTATLILSGAIPEDKKSKWALQAKFLKEIQDKYQAKFIMDVTGVGDGVIDIMKSYGIKVHMSVNYTNSSGETLDRSHPYGYTECFKVGKSVLINKTVDFFDEQVLYIYEYTNAELIKEINLLQRVTNKLGQVLFESSYWDDIVNAMLLNTYYIYQKSLLSKTVREEVEFDPYDHRTHKGRKANNRRNF